MQYTKLKSIVGVVLMSLFLITLVSNDTQAQSRKKRDGKARKAKVHSPVNHYKQQPKRGARVTRLPRKTVQIQHRNTNFHYQNGVFYRPVQGNYVVTRPPLGIRVQVLPPNPLSMRLSGLNYFYYYGTFYKPIPQGGYEVVNAPVGAMVDALPNGYEEVELDGRLYFRLDETYYKAVLNPSGYMVYEVVRI